MTILSRSSTAMRSGGAHNGYTAARPAILGLSKVLFAGLTQLSTATALPLNTAFIVARESSDEPKDAEDPSLWIYLTIAVVLVLLGGAFAGLTIALMGQDGVYLQVIAASGEGKEQRHAKRVYTLLGKGKHWVLVTLLLSNVIVNETLPIVLDRSLGGGWPAVLSSTALIGMCFENPGLVLLWLTLDSYLWRGHSPVHLCSLRHANRCRYVSICPRVDVYSRAYRLAYRETS